MEPSYFLFLILPLAALVVILVSLVLYLARKEESVYDKELKKLTALFWRGTMDKKTFVRMVNRLKQEKIFSGESERLQTLLQDKTIDQDTYVRLRKLLETTFKKRLEET